MGCDMTLDEVIRAVLATEALGSDRGQEFPARMFGLAQHILDTPAKRWDRRSVAAAGILEGLRRGDRQCVGHQLRRYWDNHLKPKPEPEWKQWSVLETNVRVCPACEHAVRVHLRHFANNVVLIDVGAAQFRICGLPTHEPFVIEQRMEVPSDD